MRVNIFETCHGGLGHSWGKGEEDLCEEPVGPPKQAHRKDKCHRCDSTREVLVTYSPYSETVISSAAAGGARI